MSLIASKIVDDSSFVLWFTYVALLGCAALTSIYSIYADSREVTKINYNKLIVIIISLAGFSICVFANYNDSNFWMDEYTQILNASVDIIIGSSREQQPPGGYVLSNFLSFIFGMGKLSSKLTGFLPMLISLYIFLIIYFKRRGFYFFATLLTSFYMFDVDIRYLALEGRSLAYGIMTMAFSALALKIYLEEKKCINLILFSFSLYIFINSLGMQPVILLFVFGLSLVTMFLISKFKNIEAAKIAIAIIVPTLLFLPIELNIIRLANKLNKFNNSFVENATSWLENINLVNFQNYFTNGYTWHYWSMAILLISGFLFIKNILKANFLYKSVGLALILWIPIFDFTFNAIVNWEMKRWYYYCFYILSNVFIIYTISYYIKDLKIKFILFIGLILMINQLQTTYLYKNEISYREDWESTYRVIKNKYNPDRVYVLGSCDMKTFWCYDFYVGAEVYGKNDPGKLNGYVNPKKLYYLEFQDNGMIWDDTHNVENKKITVVIHKNNSLEKQYSMLKEASLESIYHVNNIKDFLIITSGDDSKNKNINLLKWITSNQEAIPDNFYPYMLIIWSYHYQKNHLEMNKWINKMLSIKGMKHEFNKSVQGQRILKSINSLRN